MSDKLQFIWIDDLPDRESAAQNLGQAIGADVRFIGVRDKDLEVSIKELLSGNEPHLILIDHKLEDIKDGYFRTGSTAATVIRETWLECPIVCVSGVVQQDFGLQEHDIYEAIFPIEDISNHYDTIQSIAKSYLKYRKQRPEDIDQLITLLGDFEEEEDRLKSIIPPEIKNKLSDPSVIRHISSWIRDILFERPGFLYDRLWASTFLGVKESSFYKIEPLFETARYSGLFANDSKPRWWKSRLLSILTERVEGNGLPWEKGSRLPGLADEDFSICFVTKERFPETVAFLDDTHKDRHPMKLKETAPDESFQELLYFEELRKMNPA